MTFKIYILGTIQSGSGEVDDESETDDSEDENETEAAVHTAEIQINNMLPDNREHIQEAQKVNNGSGEVDSGDKNEAAVAPPAELQINESFSGNTEDTHTTNTSNLNSEEKEIAQDIQSVIENLQAFVESDVVIDNQLSRNSQNSTEDAQRHSDTDDTLSVFSEHSYCNPQEIRRNDSGFVDMPEEDNEQLEENIETLFEKVDNMVGKSTEAVSFEEEYQRLLHLLDESQKDMINEETGNKNMCLNKLSILIFLF